METVGRSCVKVKQIGRNDVGELRYKLNSENKLQQISGSIQSSTLPSETMGGEGISTNSSVETWLDFDLTLKIELLCTTLAPLVPLFKNLAEPNGVNFDELLHLFKPKFRGKREGGGG